MTTTSTARLDEAALQAFDTSLVGPVIRRGDAEYETARRLWNGLVDKRPALIARCAGVADVRRAVNFAREQGLVIAVRGGGHNVAGTAVVDDGLVVDLSGLQGARVDPAARTVRAQGGTTYRLLDAETQAFGLATTGGTVSETGIAGLTLGGGLGWLMGSYGLACDNLISADVVTADGDVLVVSESDHPDLLWALRGGGGNLGVVTSFQYRLYPVGPTVLAGLIVYPMSRAREVLRYYREYTSTSPDESTVYASLLNTHDPAGGDGEPAVAIILVYSGPMDLGEKVLGALRAFGSPLDDTVAPMAYVDAQRMLDETAPYGSLNYWKSQFVKDLSDELIDVLIDVGSPRPSPMSGVLIEHFHGAAARVPTEATAFGQRGTSYNVSSLSIWRDPRTTNEQIEWARRCARAIEPFGVGSGYLNYLGQDEQERVPSVYGANFERLVELKRRYDPENVFRSNQNISPTNQGPSSPGQ